MANNPLSEDFDFSQFEEDEKTEWWQPSKRDDYDLTNKLFRVGCRPAKRKYLMCKREYQTEFEECKKLKDDLDKCIKLLQFLYANKDTA